MSRQITPATTLENLKREAKRWLKALREDVDEARARLRRALPDAPDVPTLRDVQHALAVEHGLPGWTALRDRLAHDAPMRRYERVAEALVTAYATGEESAMRIVCKMPNNKNATTMKLPSSHHPGSAALESHANVIAITDTPVTIAT